MIKINIYTVSQVNRYLKKLLDNDFILSNIQVKGEISNFKKHSSGHFYFSLKDDMANMRCVMFRMQTLSLKFMPKDGDKVVITGYVSAYEKDGQCQLYCDFMQLDGVGDLYAEYEKLKEKLQKEGLFDEEHKRKLPLLPETVAVVTSETGAVIRDIINVSLRRFPKANIKLFPSAVQGEGAYKELVAQVNLINELKCADVIIIGRGGGSLEDLWNFNNEELAYAIYNSEIPVISAVGHETDFTICDFVADLRAPTPSAAAELAFPIYDELNNKIMTLQRRMQVDLFNCLESYKIKLERLNTSYYFKKPFELINQERLKSDNLNKLLNMYFEKNVQEKQKMLSEVLVKLDAISPIKTLLRGYSIATDNSGKVLHKVSDIDVGDEFRLHLSDGEVTAIREK